MLKFKLSCGHLFYKHCLALDIYNFQWFDGFNTKCPLICPECDCEFRESDWKIMDYLVEIHILQRNPVYTTYLNKEWANKLTKFVKIGKEYSFTERDKIEDLWSKTNNIPLYKSIYPLDKPSIVYFEKYNTPLNLYSFELK